jgi:asparagine synthase (glutamine-hydrolysing)
MTIDVFVKGESKPMCGFVAVYNKNRRPVQQELLEKMTDVMIHRGPDDQGHYVDGHVGLGFRRLSIIDIQNGAQPLGNPEQDIWIVFNGEIYNYMELREWLIQKGYRFYTNSDTEVIARLYEEVGTACPNYLRGMFGFAIWDGKQKTLLAVRDPFGIKPVYYSETSNGFMIGSEIKSFFESEQITRELDTVSFYHYLTFQYVPEPATMFRSIHKLRAGHKLIIQGDTLTIEPYYKVGFNPDEDKPFSYFVEKTRDVLYDSVRLHRNSDVARGAFLSGGVDSSSLAALLQQLEPTATFSVGFDIPGYSELEEARRTAAYLGTRHHEICVNAKEYMDILPSLVWHQDEPVADPSAVGIYFVSKLASEHVKVVFSGEGADEFFGGYNIYREPYSLRMFQNMPERMRKALQYIAYIMPSGMKGKSFLERGSQRLEERFFGNAKIFTDQAKSEVLPAEFLTAEKYDSSQSITAPFYKEAAEYDEITKMQYIDIHTWLRGNILMKADKMSMANSLELRVPFVDTKVFEFAATIPAKYRVNKTNTKHVLREAMKDMLPVDVQGRKKLGFPVPTRVWLRDEMYEWAKEIIHTADVDNMINKQAVLAMLERHKDGKVDVSRKLWTLLIFMLWHHIYIEEAVCKQ